MATILALMAHPDDIEITCAGTLALLRGRSCDVHMATMTPGDLGSATLSRKKIAKIRRKEAAAAASRLHAQFHCLEFDDLTIAYGEAAKRRVSALLRTVRPDVVITHPPVDYMADHEETSRLVREAAFICTIPNWKTVSPNTKKPQKPCKSIPVVLYADPIELVDHDGNKAPARYVVDISSVMETKERMLQDHDSQRAWLKQQHGEDEYILSMKRWGEERARDFSRREVRYAEGFNQHRGHGFSKEDVLSLLLGNELVQVKG